MSRSTIAQPNLFGDAEQVRTPIGVLETRFEAAPTPPGKQQAYWCWSDERGSHAFTLDEIRPVG